MRQRKQSAAQLVGKIYSGVRSRHDVGERRVPFTLSGAPATVGGIAVTGGSDGGVDVLLYNHAVATETGPPRSRNNPPAATE